MANSRRQLFLNVALLSVVTVIAGFICGIVSWLVVGGEGVEAALAAVAICLPIGVFVLVLLFRHGVSPAALIAVTIIRVGSTMALAGLVAWKLPTLRSLPFFLSVTVVYMAGLYVETWAAWREFQRDDDAPAPVDVKYESK